MVKKERFDRDEFDSLINKTYEENDYFKEEKDLKNDDFLSIEDKKKLEFLKKNKKMRLN